MSATALTAIDWLGLLGVTMVTGSILIVVVAVVAGIASDVRRTRELKHRPARMSRPELDPDVELERILAPHARRASLRVIQGGGGSERGSAA